MANIKSAEKRARTAARRARRNQQVKSTVKTAIRRFEETTGGEDSQAVDRALNRAISALDRAAEKDVIHKNTAARHKSRLMKHYHRLRSEDATN